MTRIVRNAYKDPALGDSRGRLSVGLGSLFPQPSHLTVLGEGPYIRLSVEPATT